MIIILIILVQSAYAIDSVKVTIDGAPYSCQPEEASELSEPALDLNSVVDTECLKQNRIKNPSANLYQVEKWALNMCRSKVLNLESCRKIATKPNSVCSAVVEGWYSSFNLNNHQRMMIANFCQTQLYRCDGILR